MRSVPAHTNYAGTQPHNPCSGFEVKSHPSLALRFAHAAVEHSAKAVPLVQARAWGVSPPPRPPPEDLDAFRRATDRCRQPIRQRHSDDPPSLYYSSPQQIDAESGQALVDLAGADVFTDVLRRR